MSQPQFSRETPAASTEAELAAALRRDVACERIEEIQRELKAAKKVLARDWESLSPRDRSSGSRLVKELEKERQTLLDSLD